MTRDEDVRAGSKGGWWPLVFVVLLTGWAWAPLFGLFFTGEDFTLFGRLRQGLAASPHVFRPLLTVWLGGLHDAFGVESATPFHAASLALHLANTALVFLLGRRLFDSAYVGAVAAAFFGLGGGAVDALAWIAAANRPLSTLGGLLALNGLVRFGIRPWAPLVLLVGLAWQFGSNEEFYGTAALAFVWLVGLGLRSAELRKPAFGCAGVAIVALLVHRFGIGAVPEGFTVEEGLAQLWGSASERAGVIADGFGFARSPLLGVAVPVACAVLIAALGSVRAALFLFLAWGASMVPFALSDPVAYRFYPTQAATALLLIGAFATGFVRFAPVLDHARGRVLAHTGFFVGLAAAVIATHAPREHRLGRWSFVLQEIEACAGPIRELAELSPDTPPIMVNVDATTVALAYYYWDFADHTDVKWTGFLDAASGYVPIAAPPPEPWFGRRCEGSYGIIEPLRYFAERPAIEGVRLYSSVEPVASLREARERLTDLSVDIARTAVVEAQPAELASLDADENAQLEILEPFVNHQDFTASMRVRVTSESGALFVYQEGWLYDAGFHFAPDWALLSGLTLLRPIRLRATTADGAELPTYYANAFGLSALVPGGTHEVQLDFYRLKPSEWRGD